MQEWAEHTKNRLLPLAHDSLVSYYLISRMQQMPLFHVHKMDTVPRRSLRWSKVLSHALLVWYCQRSPPVVHALKCLKSEHSLSSCPPHSVDMGGGWGVNICLIANEAKLRTVAMALALALRRWPRIRSKNNPRMPSSALKRVSRRALGYPWFTSRCTACVYTISYTWGDWKKGELCEKECVVGGKGMMERGIGEAYAIKQRNPLQFVNNCIFVHK